jgi:UDPglucose 6-dehydrogenase
MGAQAWMAEATHRVNLSQVERIVSLIESLGSGRVKNFGVLGLSYKPRTNVVEQSQALFITQKLSSNGHTVIVFDPAAMESARAELGDSVTYARSADECVQASDLVVLATPWPEFQELSPRIFKGKVVFDCWRFFGEDVRKVSDYTSVGTGK